MADIDPVPDPNEPDLPSLQIGDIIEIPRDQYGKPVLRFDPRTHKPLEPPELQKFKIVELTEIGGVVRGWKLEPYHG